MFQVASVGLMTSNEHHKTYSVAASGGSRHLSGYDDDALMVRAQDGDKEAYEVLVGRHADLVLAIATRFLCNPDAGRDVAQEVFLDLWLSRLRYRPEGRFRRYLTTLVLNRCRDATRRVGSEQRRRDGLATQGSADPRTPSDEVVQRQSSQRLLAALARLDPADREILVMRFAMDLAYEEIAEQTARPTGTLRSRVFHSLRKLRTLLEGES
jgi:RNA polymerase sigma-70 factor (ECF subfamily)